uniref:Serine/threonine-protein phosphatase 7 long form homolog n=1 Tax=Nicotiana tabacum TaxID=4097 RepID=A0A1S3Y541_TOBAC
MKEWPTWVDLLKPLYQDIWKKDGIFEAVIASTFKIHRHNDLIIALVERWCLETNTFILPWGEATVTLEDMVVLGGYSVLGHCVLKPVKAKDSVAVEKTLCEAHKTVRARNVTHHAWMEYFAGKGDHLEHVAFLTLWLSRYVLPSKSYQTVDRALFPIAIYLSQGIPIALAPAVLSSIYRDL